MNRYLYVTFKKYTERSPIFIDMTDMNLERQHDIADEYCNRGSTSLVGWIGELPQIATVRFFFRDGTSDINETWIDSTMTYDQQFIDNQPDFIPNPVVGYEIISSYTPVALGA